MILFETILILASLLLLLLSMTGFSKIKNLIYPIPVVLFFLLILKGIGYGRVPYANIYDTLLLAAFVYSVRIIFTGKDIRDKLVVKLPLALLLLVGVVMPTIFPVTGDMPAVLTSIWFYLYVPVCIIGCVSLLIACVLYFTARLYGGDYNEIIKNELKVAFFFLALGLAAGVIWADTSWGEVWGWYPEEIWLFITWVLAGLTLHLRNRKLFHVFIVVAFVVMLYMLFGVTFTADGWHWYGI